MATLAELSSLIRSKNAGPFVLTFDIMFQTQEVYERVKQARPIDADVLARTYGTRVEDVIVVYHDQARAIKASIPRPVIQGDIGDSDCYGGQQYAPLMSLQVD